MDIEEKTLLERLATKVNAKMGSSIISSKNCYINSCSLSFYSNFKLYTLFDISFTPVVQYQLLDNGCATIFLNGNYDCWFESNKIELPSLSLSNIMEYLKLAFNSGLNHSSKNTIVTSLDDIDFSQMPSVEKFNQIESAIRPPVISFKDNTYSILTCILEGKNLYDCLITVKTDGTIDVLDKNRLLEDIPVDELALD